ncbi:beta-galactosidase [Paenibacillus bovis]|uniref:Beta-galactosidase n=1 Tax=Paenibacillus bovis TaxID=1616788 RepID=A0A172ZGL1_9BACL|nr:beta-galactosidase [Paenibacillus bovis]ANF96784.1 beta-galactosidase [Paenibacillus bovis]
MNPINTTTVTPSWTQMLHGADYNPEQWRHRPDILEEDIRLMKLAKCNVMSVGIFSWVSLEPEEGVYTFEWLDEVLDRFAANGISALLATPSGARPAWMSAKYPEVLRVEANRVRNLHGFRHNHCFTSPVYREKVTGMNTLLAERYSNHPAVIGWHISNEYGGECHCDYCQEAFRNWVKQKYGTLEQLNLAWWTTFWSHTYTDWSQVESPAPHGETQVHGMNLDWRRFVTDQTVDFCRHEIEPLRHAERLLPVTTNFMEFFEGLNYWKFADILDILSWDSYPTWHDHEGDTMQAAKIAMMHDIVRSIKQQPFLLMESTPSLTNWQPISKNKRPGMHLLSSLQAVAHGSDSVQYFQWRKSQGSSEKLHGAVVDHAGHEHTRVFRDVQDVGTALEQLQRIRGSQVQAEVAVIFDWENRWAVKDSQGPRNTGIGYEETVLNFYRAFWERGIAVDVIDMEQDLSKYKVVAAPMLYMVREGVGERFEKFVEAGGTLISTYWSGIVNENDLCFLGGFPGPLRSVLGIWSEEIDGLHINDRNRIIADDTNELGLQGTYEVQDLCDLIHLESAKSLAVYGDDFYAGRPAVTVNHYGSGEAYYVAARTKDHFLSDLIESITTRAGVKRTIAAKLPQHVTAHARVQGEEEFVFVQNYSDEVKSLQLDDNDYEDLLNAETMAPSSTLELQPFGIRILKRQL